MGVDLDLNHTLWTKTRGEFTAYGTWIRIEGDFKPCLVIVRAGSELSGRLVPCCITQNRAWVWDERVGDPAEAARTCAMFLEHMSLSVTTPRAIALASFIHDLLGDLLHIPPYERDRSADVVAEITMTDAQTGRTIEHEVRDE